MEAGISTIYIELKFKSIINLRFIDISKYFYAIKLDLDHDTFLSNEIAKERIN